MLLLCGAQTRCALTTRERYAAAHYARERVVIDIYYVAQRVLRAARARVTRYAAICACFIQRYVEAARFYSMLQHMFARYCAI